MPFFVALRWGIRIRATSIGTIIPISACEPTW